MSIKIDRAKLEADLLAFIRKEGGMVIGDPGVGKSFSLRVVRKRLIDDGFLVRFLPIDRIASQTRSEILREIDFSDDWTAQLQQSLKETGAVAGVLIFDSFDSLRNSETRKIWLGIIAEAVRVLSGNGWTIVTSCRTYDAEKSHALKEVFTKDDRTLGAFYVQALSPSELDVFLTAHPLIEAAYKASNDQVRALFHIPFYLDIVDQLIADGVNPETFRTWGSAAQLLREIFTKRLAQHGHERRLEVLLKELTSKQVSSMALATDWRELDGWSDAEADELISAKLIAEDKDFRKSIRFSHNIFFDFATAEYLMPSRVADFVRFVSERPERQLFLRPSLQFYLSERFNASPNSYFWNIAESALREDMSKVAPLSRVIVPSVAVSEARKIEQLNRVLELLAAGGSDGRTIVTSILRVLKTDTAWVTVPDRRTLWLEVIIKISLHLDHAFSWDFGMVLDLIVKEAMAAKSPQELRKCSDVAHQLLRWEWEQKRLLGEKWMHGVAAAWAIPLTCKTYAANPDGGRPLLQAVLAILSEPNFSVECLYRLCDAQSVVHVIEADPAFGIQIYQSIFLQKDAGEGTITQGIIVPLIFSRRDEFHMCRYNLIQAFPRFLQAHPVQAFEACISAVEAATRREHINDYENRNSPGEPFLFRGVHAAILQDYSHIWDERAHPDDEQQLLQSADGFLRNIDVKAGALVLGRILDVFAAKAKVAVLWKHLLELGVDRPESFGLELIDLCLAQPILMCMDTTYEAGELIRKLSEHLDSSRLLALEKGILAIPEETTEGQEESYGGTIKKRLISVLGNKAQTEEGKVILVNIASSEESVANRPLHMRGQVTSRLVTSEMWLERMGVDLDEPTNRELHQVLDALQKLNRGNTPPDDKPLVDALLAATKEAKRALAEISDAHERVKKWGLTEIASAAERLAGAWDILSQPDQVFVRQLVLTAAVDPSPEYDPAHDDNWKSSSWSPAPRNEAAKTAPWLLLQLPEDQELKDRVLELIKDKVPTVRFLLASEIWRMYERNPDFLLQVLTYFVENEKNATVMDAVCMSIRNASHLVPVRALTPRLYKRLLNEPEPVEYHKDILEMMVDEVLRKQESWPEREFEEWAADPIKFNNELLVATDRLTKWCEPEVEEPFQADAIKLQGSFLNAILKRLLVLNGQKEPPVDEDTKKKSHVLFRAIDNVVTRLFFACDFERRFNKGEPEIPLKTRMAFFNRIVPLLKQISDFAAKDSGVLIPSTAHHFMELLRSALQNGGPALEILAMAHDVAAGGDKTNYSLDSMAVDEVVKLVETIVADHRLEVQNPQSMAQLMGLLDIFARVGWPKALQLIWRLDEIYR